MDKAEAYSRCGAANHVEFLLGELVKAIDEAVGNTVPSAIDGVKVRAAQVASEARGDFPEIAGYMDTALRGALMAVDLVNDGDAGAGRRKLNVNVRFDAVHAMGLACLERQRAIDAIPLEGVADGD